MLLLIPQRYEFSSKSQHGASTNATGSGCCWYHKGTNFQANHNNGCMSLGSTSVVADTTKVRIFKQITTRDLICFLPYELLLIPQRYEFSSKSQHGKSDWRDVIRCCWYHKGTNFQANHNVNYLKLSGLHVVADTTKVRIFKQITTATLSIVWMLRLLLIPQRYEFSSKSQRKLFEAVGPACCCWYHKGTNFQANHNNRLKVLFSRAVVADTTKVRIFKQITTKCKSFW